MELSGFVAPELLCVQFYMPVKMGDMSVGGGGRQGTISGQGNNLT